MIRIVKIGSVLFGDLRHKPAQDERHQGAVMGLLLEAGVSKHDLEEVRRSMDSLPCKPVATFVRPLLDELDNLHDQFCAHKALFGDDVPFEYDVSPSTLLV